MPLQVGAGSRRERLGGCIGLARRREMSPAACVLESRRQRRSRAAVHRFDNMGQRAIHNGFT